MGEALKGIPGYVNVKRIDLCYDCRECSNYCPIAQKTTRFNPRRISRKMKDAPHSVLTDKDLWLCAGCYLCFERCPHKVPFTQILSVIRNTAAEKGNINAITDAGVAAHALMAAMEGAALNVRINLDNITDKSYTGKTAKEVEKLLADGAKLKAEVLEIVEAKMKELAESS